MKKRGEKEYVKKSNGNGKLVCSAINRKRQQG